MANTLAYGFVSLEHLAAERVTVVGEQRVYTAIQESLAEHTRQINALLSLFVEITTDHKIRYVLAGDGTLQPLDEHGNPKVVRPSGYYDVAFPIQGGGTAWGDNRVSRALMTVDEANRNTLDAQARDADWLRRHAMAAVFDDTAWTYEDEQYGDLTIEPLASGDSVKYNKVGGTKATDTHYLAQAAAIDDSHNPFDDIYSELVEHPSNRDPVVVYISTSLKATVMALTAFVEVVDRDLRYGVATTQVDPGVSLDSIRGLGDEVLGKVNHCWIVEWRALPSGYMLAHAQGGGPVLKMREHPAPELRGLFAENHSPDGNLREVRMIRYCGFGVANRVGAVVYYVGGGAYAIPTGYDAPLPV
jgi:hypothetical protein